MKSFRAFLEIIKRILEVFTALSFLVLLFDVLWGVFSRYIIGTQSRWTEELAIYLLVWVTFLATPLAYHEKAHLGVDFLVRKMHPSVAPSCEVITHICSGLFSVIVLCFGGWLLVSETLEARQLSPALGVPVGIFYSVVPISGAILSLFCLYGILNPQPAQADALPETD